MMYQGIFSLLSVCANGKTQMLLKTHTYSKKNNPAADDELLSAVNVELYAEYS